MDILFDFKRQAIGPDFVGRELEQNSLGNLIRQGQHVVIYAQEGMGKKSLVNKVFVNLRRASFDVVVCKVNLMKVRTEEDFYESLRLSIENLFGPISTEKGEGLFEEVEILAQKGNQKVVLYFEEFQNILFFDDYQSFLQTIKGVMSRSNGWNRGVTYLISGSMVNSMKQIFEKEKYLYGLIENFPIRPLASKPVLEYVNRVFLKVGRVINARQVEILYNISGGVPYYILQLCYFTFNSTKGYVTDDVIQDSINALISLNEDKFKYILSTLSNYQIGLLKAIIKGTTKFGNKEIIEFYGLNSSANVFRLKEALVKKEVVTLDENHEPFIINPIFKYWLKEYYFR